MIDLDELQEKIRRFEESNVCDVPMSINDMRDLVNELRYMRKRLDPKAIGMVEVK